MKSLRGTLAILAFTFICAILALVAVAPKPVEAQSRTQGVRLYAIPFGSGLATPLLEDLVNGLLVSHDHPTRLDCTLTTSATTSTAITGCTAPAAGVSIYVTDLAVYGGAAVGVTAAATIQTGTGGSCGTNTTVLYYCQHGATAGCEAHFSSPIKLPAASELCLLDGTTGTKFVTANGYTGP